MSKIFKLDDTKTKRIPRNKVPLSNSNSGSCNFGELIPIMCKEMIPGDGFSMRPVIDLRSMPIVFPVRTRMRCYVNYFAVRNRILMDDWKGFITQTKDGIVKPTLRLNADRARKMIKTGTLGDYLGVPSTVGGDFPILNYIADIKHFRPMIFNVKPSDSHVGVYSSVQELFDSIQHFGFDATLHYRVTSSNQIDSFGYHLDLSGLSMSSLPDSISTNIPTPNPVSPSSQFLYVALVINNDFVAYSQATVVGDSFGFTISIPQSLKDAYSNALLNGTVDTFGFSFFLYAKSATITDFVDSPIYQSYILPFVGNLILLNGLPQLPSNLFNRIASFETSRKIDATSDAYLNNNKFYGDNPVIPLDALPFRAYEMVYNYFFRNDINNPYKYDGVHVDYDKFLPSTADGEDHNEYVLHNRNWELDAYTSCSPSPQFGMAPLVGLEYSPIGQTAELTFQATEDGQTKNYTVKVGVTPDGDIDSIVDYDQGTPSGTLRRIMDLSTTTGISINNLRNVNKYQKFKERMLSKGSLRYHDQMEAHFGIAPNYPDIDVPEYIGGFSGDLVSSRIENLAEGSAPLGDIAGRIDAIIQANHDIRYRATEHCFIIGVLSIVPIPVYSQTLDKMFLRYHPLDYYTPEFAKIGKVPVYRSEFMPLQCSNDEVNEVFGYQKPNYDYLECRDELHGDMRLSLSDFSINRFFASKPYLNEAFTICRDSDLNNIWATDSRIVEKYGNSKHFLYTITSNLKALRPIPVHFSASLE